MPRIGLVDWRRRDDFAPLMLVMCEEKNRLVRSLGEVAKVLVVGLPTDDGKEYIAAVKACLDAIQGDIPANTARAIRAAEEAGMRVVTGVH
ncbi:hypothetical protein CO652_22025 [Rhizobium sp. H4]|uniref:DUF982 domain-containing protein n=1 Tax=Rhizobium TaxID=379 RepID=UPI000BE8CAB5|nr:MULTISPECIES: DUF982 domain-containing protein [Rhizobium]PDV86136.1 hypothetical protein CO652_22025 [Rhizobium sp. H4]WET74604.1 DUF982 domain-containing protein [Rhizobium croatiense]